MSLSSEIIFKYFPELNRTQKKQFENMFGIYAELNRNVNVISRKDFDNFYERHVLHSLGIAKIIHFQKETSIVDVGSGGGFPGIPLAVLFPDSQFTLVDSIGKKTEVARMAAQELGLKNVISINSRSEDIKTRFDFLIGRAVKPIPEFLGFSKHLVNKHGKAFYLKGGDFENELKKIRKSPKVYNLSDFFKEEFFETKKVVQINL